MFPNRPAASVRTRTARKAPAPAFPPPLTHRKASIITASASSSRAFSICAITAFRAGTITARLAEKTFAFLSWSPAAATALSGTTPPKRPSISASTAERLVLRVGDRVSFFVIAGDKSDEIYTGYRQLTGVTHLLPKAAYGYIQSKAIYPTQEQALDIAKDIATASCRSMCWSSTS